MKLVLLLLVLAIRRFEVPLPFHWQAVDSFERFSRSLEGFAEPLRLPDVVSWGLQTLLPVLLLAWGLSMLAGSFGGVLVWVAVVVLLLAILGTRSALKLLDEYVVYRRMGMEEQAADSERRLKGEAEAPLFDTLLLKEARFFFAPLFYVVVLGYWAAVFYVLNYLLARREGRTAEIAQVVDNALYWLPSRVLALVMGVAGNGAALWENIQRDFFSLAVIDELLLTGARGAIRDKELKQNLSTARDLDELEALESLLLRCLAIWLIGAAVWVLFG